jgi:hypothetical protein
MNDVLSVAGTRNTGHNDASHYPKGQEPKNYVHDSAGHFINSPMFFPQVLATGAGYNTSAYDLLSRSYFRICR